MCICLCVLVFSVMALTIYPLAYPNVYVRDKSLVSFDPTQHSEAAPVFMYQFRRDTVVEQVVVKGSTRA